MHHILLCQCPIKKDDEMWFLVSSKGLSFGPIPQHNQTSLRIRDDYFNDENKVHSDHFEKVFLSFGEVKKHNNKQKKKFDNLKDEDMVKLVLLYFIEHVLLGK